MKLSYSFAKRSSRLSMHRGKIWNSAYEVKHTGGELLIEFKTRLEKLLADAIEKSRIADEDSKRTLRLYHKGLVSKYADFQSGQRSIYHSNRVNEIKRLLEFINN
jgi:hypothetical protein